MLMPIHTARRQRATQVVESSSAMDISLTYWVPRFWAAKDSDFITGQTVAVDGGSINTWQVATAPIARNTKSPRRHQKACVRHARGYPRKLPRQRGVAHSRSVPLRKVGTACGDEHTQDVIFATCAVRVDRRRICWHAQVYANDLVTSRSQSMNA